VEPDSVLYVFNRLLVGFTLRVTSLKRWAGGDVEPILIPLYQNGKSVGRHRLIIQDGAGGDADVAGSAGADSLGGKEETSFQLLAVGGEG